MGVAGAGGEGDGEVVLWAVCGGCVLRVECRLSFNSIRRAASRAAAIDAAGDLASNGRGERAVGAECRVVDSMDIAREDALKRD